MLPFLISVPVVWEKITNPWNFWQFVQEDGPVEWATALMYLFAAPIAGFLAIRFRNQGLALHAFLIGGLGLLMFFVGMEEISWGQRVLGIETPASFVKVNHQEETNLHNIISHSAVQLGFIVVAIYGSIASFVMPGLLKPFFGSRAKGLAALVSPPNFLKSYFLLTLAVQMLFVASPMLEAIFGPQWGFTHTPDKSYFLIGRDREIVEFLTALGFFLFLCWLFVLERWGEWEGDRPAVDHA